MIADIFLNRMKPQTLSTVEQRPSLIQRLAKRDAYTGIATAKFLYSRILTELRHAEVSRLWLAPDPYEPGLILLRTLRGLDLSSMSAYNPYRPRIATLLGIPGVEYKAKAGAPAFLYSRIDNRTKAPSCHADI